MSDKPRLDERAISDLLGSLRDTEPTPPDVVARLDDTLAELRRELADPVVIDLATRRHRRRNGLLVAAAACGALVLGGTVINNWSGLSVHSASDAGGGVSEATSRDAAAGDAAGGGDSGSEEFAAKAIPAEPRSQVRSVNLRADVRAVLTAKAGVSADPSANPICADINRPRGVAAFEIEYDDTPAVLLATKRTSTSVHRRVRIVACESGQVLAKLTLR